MLRGSWYHWLVRFFDFIALFNGQTCLEQVIFFMRICLLWKNLNFRINFIYSFLLKNLILVSLILSILSMCLFSHILLEWQNRSVLLALNALPKRLQILNHTLALTFFLLRRLFIHCLKVFRLNEVRILLNLSQRLPALRLRRAL